MIIATLGIILALLASSTYAAHPQVYTDANSASRLASEGVIVQKESRAAFRLDDKVLRQEVVGTAIKMAGIQLQDSYACKGYYSDLSQTQPNNWSCRAFELAADAGIVSR